MAALRAIGRAADLDVHRMTRSSTPKTDFTAENPRSRFEFPLPKLEVSCDVVDMDENRIAAIIVGAALDVHRELGPGLLESVYRISLAHALGEHGLRVESEVPVPVRFRGVHMDLGFRADLIVERRVLVEVKSVERAAPVHRKQVLTYLRFTELRLGLLINFGMPLIRDGIARVVRGLPEGTDRPC